MQTLFQTIIIMFEYLSIFGTTQYSNRVRFVGGKRETSPSLLMAIYPTGTASSISDRDALFLITDKTKNLRGVTLAQNA
jgi:hypothetical protein